VHFRSIPARHLTEETCRKWRYGVANWNGETVQVAQYVATDGHGVAAQKVRTRDKRFSWVGNPKAAESLYGRSLWGRDKGRRVIVVEGEIDALSLSQVLDHKWPVVSLSNGAGSAERAVRDNLEWLEQYDEVVLMLDQDDEGRKGAEAAAAVLSPGKARIAVLPLKDASDMLKAGRVKELCDAQWEARAWRPDGVLEGDELWAKVSAPMDTNSVPYPWAGLQAKLHGLRRREIVTVCAGTGIGKSTVARELGLHLIRSGEKLGVIALEESVRETALGMLSNLTGRHLRLEEPDWAALRPVWEEQVKDRLAIFDHFGSLDSKKLLSRVRFMTKGLGCGWILFDHLTIAVSGLESENERKDIDVLCTSLRQLVEEAGCGLILVSQLKRRPGQGKGYEEGAVPRLSDLRGSSSIEQVSNIVIVLSRDTTAGDGLTDLNVAKNRFTGETGPAGTLEWSLTQARYTEMTCFPEDAE